MNQRLKRWESPRREGRNDKGRGGSARQRQLKKQAQMLRRKLKEGDKNENNKKQGGEKILPPLFLQLDVVEGWTTPVKAESVNSASKEIPTSH